MSTDKNQVGTGSKVSLWVLGALAIICFGCLVGLMHKNAVHGVFAALVMTVETLVCARYVSKIDEAAQDDWKTMAFSCAGLWGVGLGSVAGLMMWSFGVFIVIGGCWAAIGFGFGALMYKLDKSTRTQTGAGTEAKNAAEEKPKNDQQ